MRRDTGYQSASPQPIRQEWIIKGETLLSCGSPPTLEVKACYARIGARWEHTRSDVGLEGWGQKCGGKEGTKTKRGDESRSHCRNFRVASRWDRLFKDWLLSNCNASFITFWSSITLQRAYYYGDICMPILFWSANGFRHKNDLTVLHKFEIEPKFHYSPKPW